MNRKNNIYWPVSQTLMLCHAMEKACNLRLVLTNIRPLRGVWVKDVRGKRRASLLSCMPLLDLFNRRRVWVSSACEWLYLMGWERDGVVVKKKNITNLVSAVTITTRAAYELNWECELGMLLKFQFNFCIWVEAPDSVFEFQEV